MEVWFEAYGQYFLLGVIVLCFGFLLLRQHLLNNTPEYVASATVVSRRMGVARHHSKWSSGWNYMVTFQAGCDTIELYVTELDYRELTEGLPVTIRWQNENLLHYEPEQ